MKIRSYAVMAVLCAVSVTAGAQASAGGAGKKQLVQKVLQLQQSGIESFARSVAEQPAAQMLQAAGRALQSQPADKREALAKQLQADAQKYADEVTPILRKRAVELAPQTVGALLEQRLSEAELNTLIQWLQSPVSRKFAEIQGELQQSLGEKLVADTRSTVEPKLKALQQTMANRLGVSTGEAPAPGSAAPAK